jgi:hypothetical protein
MTYPYQATHLQELQQQKQNFIMSHCSFPIVATIFKREELTTYYQVFPNEKYITTTELMTRTAINFSLNCVA